MRNKTDKSTKILLIIALIFILGGSGIFLYPTISNKIAEKEHVEAIRNYDEIIGKTNDQILNEELKKAQFYNENLSGDPVHDPFVKGSGYALPENYKEVLNISKDGIMAYVEIPKISVYLPIYHGTSEDVLEKGVGHIQSTSLPIGGDSTHCVLTGHTGLPSAELFTRIDELEIGDIFYIHVLNEILTYKIYETKVILPDKIDELQITNENDFVTLVTCTPYGVNSHRLLVKAKQTEFEEYKEKNEHVTEVSDIREKENNNKNYYLTGIEIGGVVFIIILIVIFILSILIKKGSNRYE